jgi:NAD(P)-dependent dehydrogenase (short-subunit alcohol dehydrogenase family)
MRYRAVGVLDSFKLDGKVAIVTGASSGLGVAFAEGLADAGADVAICARRVEKLEDTRKRVEETGRRCIAVPADVAKPEDCQRVVDETVEQLGRVDVLINNAGVGFSQSAGTAPDARALKVIEVNMLGPWRVTSAALPALRSSRGRVVNVSSGLAHVTAPFATAYCMSKRGVVAYSDALRLEHGDAITVTTVYPGYIKTPIHDASNADGFSLDGLVPEEPLASAAATLVRAALGPPARDLATTRHGAVGYALARRAPRRLMDRLTLRTLRRHATAGRFDGSEMAREFVQRVRAMSAP